MRPNEKASRSRLIHAAMGKLPCDLCVENVQLVNVFTGEIYPASVDVLDGAVVRVREEGQPAPLAARQIYDGKGAYLLPGFIDTHMHVESTMMIPENLSRAILPWGTTTVCTDPHEIANVMGLEGVRFMLENAKRSTLRQYILAPSCVPAVPALEGAGASFGPGEIGELLDMPGVVGIAEIMDFVGVYQDSGRMHSIIEEGSRRGMFLQGHAPHLSGGALAAYRLGGPISDHESVSPGEIREKLRMGMHINLRASSIIDSLQVLLEGCRDHPWRDLVSMCTDDVHAGDLLTTGHINAVFAKAVAGGVPAVEAVKMATLNAAREYGFDDLGAIAPGYLADMQLVAELDGRMPNAVFLKGLLVAENGVYLGSDRDDGPSMAFPNTIHMPQIQGPEDFRLKAPEGCGGSVKVLVVVPEEETICRRGEWMELPVSKGYVDLAGRDDLQFICVANRHGSGDKTVAVLKGFGLREGAVASTISHDSHNFTVVYRQPEEAFAAAQILSQCGGGMCAVRDGKELATLALPVAGLMSPRPCSPLSQEIAQVHDAMLQLCPDQRSLLSIAILALPVLPGVIVTDRGLVDGLSQQFMELFA